MSLLSRLFGGGSAPAEAKPMPTTYNGFEIFPEPVREGSQFRVAARIVKVVDGQTRTHNLVRADTLGDLEGARAASVRKAKQMIDEQGDQLFG